MSSGADQRGQGREWRACFLYFLCTKHQIGKDGYVELPNVDYEMGEDVGTTRMDDNGINITDQKGEIKQTK